FKSAGKEVTSIPVDANGSARLTIEVKPFEQVEAGSYSVNVVAQGGDASASLDLTAEVTGQPTLSITTPDGRLSAQAYVGKESPLKILLRNTGTAAAHGIELNATEPSGWTVSFNPKTIDELPAGEQKEVEVSVRPADKAVAGDYMVTIRATPDEGGSKSAEFRITVLTSTLWGVAGIGLIAIAVAVVALAVMQFGRR
ncbi:MAG: ABC transporter substrate-binding protein, partial [Caldilineae bacterium]